jgi:glycine/D-amino acid oxidase-like deaminating enzyme
MAARPDTFEASLWSALTPPAANTPALREQLGVDVGVVGAGILGLSAALHLAQAGVSVAVLDAGPLGHGASGRNTGFVVPSLKGAIGFDDVARTLGPEIAERLLRRVLGAGTFVFHLIREHGIECAAEQNGWLQPAPTAETAVAMQLRASEAARLGHTVHLLDAAEVRATTGIGGYLNALFDPSGGQINPLAYVRGLASAAMRHGARIFSGTRVIALERAAQSWSLSVDTGGVLRAGTVLLTTNALVGPLVPELARSLLPVRGYQVASQPMPPAIQQRILPGRQPLVDLRHHPFAVRWSPDGRLVTGGGAVINNPGAVPRMARFLLRRLARMVPELPPLQPAFAWDGVIAATGDFLPKLFELGPGLLAPIGCNGRGVALTTTFGAALAAYLCTGEAADLPVAPTPPRPWKLHGPMRFAPAVWLAGARLRDWNAERSRTSNWQDPASRELR